MPSRNFTMIHMGVAFASSVFKPLAISSKATVVFHQRSNPVLYFLGASDNLATTRSYCSSSSNSKPSSGTVNSEINLSQKLSDAASSSPSPPPVKSTTTRSSIGGYHSTALDSTSSTSDKELDEETVKTFRAGDVETYFDLSKSFTRSEKWKSMLVNSMLVYPNFISNEEEVAIMKEIEPYISRLHYENCHWDDAIHEYRETERSKWNKTNEKVINRIRELAFPPGVPQLKLVHILDLAKKGIIKPHIDSIRFCGNTIAGLSLLSSCVMRLKHDVQTDFTCDVYLPRYSLYVMKDFSRFELTHEILGEDNSKFKKEVVKRDRRVSIICRNEPESTAGPVFNPINV